MLRLSTGVDAHAGKIVTETRLHEVARRGGHCRATTARAFETRLHVGRW
ncbi:hypothetical protein [Lysobacter gummosus]